MIIDYNDGKYFDNVDVRHKVSTVKCKCGSMDFMVNYIPPPCNTGGFFKITCPDCGNSKILMDDYS